MNLSVPLSSQGNPQDPPPPDASVTGAGPLDALRDDESTLEPRVSSKDARRLSRSGPSIFAKPSEPQETNDVLDPPSQEEESPPFHFDSVSPFASEVRELPLGDSLPPHQIAQGRRFLLADPIPPSPWEISRHFFDCDGSPSEEVSMFVPSPPPSYQTSPSVSPLRSVASRSGTPPPPRAPSFFRRFLAPFSCAYADSALLPLDSRPRSPIVTAWKNDPPPADSAQMRPPPTSQDADHPLVSCPMCRGYALLCPASSPPPPMRSEAICLLAPAPFSSTRAVAFKSTSMRACRPSSASRGGGRLEMEPGQR